jgi:hypothetical protein
MRDIFGHQCSLKSHATRQARVQTAAEYGKCAVVPSVAITVFTAFDEWRNNQRRTAAVNSIA